ncbi:aspartyl/asparaginyl beta-hydroxylase domain-containing protein [Coralloluteibacterium stylophorae]|uniref:Aspartyl/asparaginyl beta-hydroxylase domain-containing protein n=1 Tax=Coralloluteibacterium stylophorae TaxID=1776034 RepID=A0A8J7VU37_9GAMM|nr:aspartyl/asparaginyl beta-hydroxylase domain-containing protein [Coralloluteibacterium stylophorae]MBS7457525.1 aspartyl/asparaginyl beta-hydroxylase domain-containing protein [Coralloluteibacterium stylophorae]
MQINLLGPVALVIYAFLACVLLVHFTHGRVRLPLRRQLVNHSAFFAPYNLLAYGFSSVPVKPYLDLGRFPELALLRDNWETIRDEAARLFDAGYIRAAEANNDASFNSFFKEGWKRFYLKWYGEALPSAQALCPETVRLVNALPNCKAAMFALLPPGAKLSPHRDPFAGSLRYHLGLITPNSDDCRIVVDGESYSWRDGRDVMFDETYVHWAENRSDRTRVILFCDIERPLHTPLLRGFNRLVSTVMGRATSTGNAGQQGERVGLINRLYGLAHHVGVWRKGFKKRNPRLYRYGRVVLVLAVVAAVFVRV